MFEYLTRPPNLAKIVQDAIAPVVFLTALAGLMNVFSTRLGRVADHVDRATDELETADARRSDFLLAELAYLRKRSRVLDTAVVLAVLAGIAICSACFVLFLGTLLERSFGLTFVFLFAIGFLCTIGALGAFLMELLSAGRGLRRESVGKPVTPGSDSA